MVVKFTPSIGSPLSEKTWSIIPPTTFQTDRHCQMENSFRSHHWVNSNSRWQRYLVALKKPHSNRSRQFCCNQLKKTRDFDSCTFSNMNFQYEHVSRFSRSKNSPTGFFQIPWNHQSPRNPTNLDSPTRLATSPAASQYPWRASAQRWILQ